MVRVSEHKRAEPAAPSAAQNSRLARPVVATTGLASLEAPLIAVLLATFARTFLFQGLLIPTTSMEPGLQPGDHVVVNKLIFSGSPRGAMKALLPQRNVRRSDVVVFALPERPSTLLVKRCIGLAGERVEIIEHRVHIDGRQLDEGAYLDRPGTSDGGADPNMAEIVVPQDHLFVLGDDRDSSLDSRRFGAVPLSAVIGRVAIVYWSFDSRPRADDLGALGRSTRFVRDLALRTRWRRTFKVVR